MTSMEIKLTLKGVQKTIQIISFYIWKPEQADFNNKGVIFVNIHAMLKCLLRCHYSKYWARSTTREID